MDQAFDADTDIPVNAINRHYYTNQGLVTFHRSISCSCQALLLAYSVKSSIVAQVSDEMPSCLTKDLITD